MQGELIPVAAKWRSIGIALRLKHDVLENIDTKHSGKPHECLSDVVTEWLKKNYSVEKFGEPTWQWLVKAVDHPAGGANKALAIEIARRHKAGGIYVCLVTVTVNIIMSVLTNAVYYHFIMHLFNTWVLSAVHNV